MKIKMTMKVMEMISVKMEMREEKIPNPGHLRFGWSVITATYAAPLIFKYLARLVFRQNMDVFGAMWMESSNVYGDRVIQ